MDVSGERPEDDVDVPSDAAEGKPAASDSSVASDSSALSDGEPPRPTVADSALRAATAPPPSLEDDAALDVDPAEAETLPDASIEDILAAQTSGSADAPEPAETAVSADSAPPRAAEEAAPGGAGVDTDAPVADGGANDESDDAASTADAEAADAETGDAETGDAEAGDAATGDREPEPLDENLEAWRAVPLATRLEALLFAATAPLSLRRLQTLAGDVEAADVRDALDSLQAHYDASARAFGIQEIGGGYQLRTNSELSGLLARLGRKTTSEKLSPASIETLAIVAYRQPVLRVDVEKIRGVASGEVLRSLVEKGLVRVAGRADLPGSPLLYGTTPAFLEVFGLRDLRDLPSDREMLRKPL